MAKIIPTVYIFHGEDDFAINQFIEKLIAKLGDPGKAMMNVTRLDGSIIRLGELENAVYMMPFLADRRIVILTKPLAGLNEPEGQDKFIELLNRVPQSTALLLVEYRPLMVKRKADGKLLKWAQKNSTQVYLRAFPLPKGEGMEAWILKKVSAEGCVITEAAAKQLAELVGEDTRLADLEIQKLLAYVNYHRMIEIKDVETVTALIPEGKIFSMMDALSEQNGKEAMLQLQRLLETEDPAYIFAMIVRQFRLLILARDAINRGRGVDDLILEYRVKPKLKSYPAKLAFSHARHYSLPVLENVYHRLLEIDRQLKRSQISPELAVETFVVAFTS
jgi:DNA polymerase-3 subunit delta